MARVEGFDVGRSGLQPVDSDGAPLPVGVWGDSDTGMGVLGTSGPLPAGTTPPAGDPAGVVGTSVQNPGVLGRSLDSLGVIGQSQELPGMLGQSQNNPGVIGASFSPVSSGVTASNVAGGRGVSAFVGDAEAVFGSSRRTGTGVSGGNFRGLNPAGTQELPATGIGVSGVSQDTGTGVRGFSPDGEGVGGDSNAGSGVIGASFTGSGLQGASLTGSGAEATSILGYGLIGMNWGSVDPRDRPAAAVLGASFNNAGVIGHAKEGSGVVGSSDDGLAGEFLGDVRITGKLFLDGFLIGNLLFKMDHPTDPSNKYLNYSSVASPEPKHVYDGVVELDSEGAALVELPEWVDALDEDFRYQLTPIGASAPGLHIGEEIAERGFRIAGGVPNSRVSWQVTGKQQDPVTGGGYQVEQQKPSTEVGRYLHPEAVGQSDDTGIGRDPHREEQVRAIRQWLAERPLPMPPTMDFAQRDEKRRRAEELTRRMAGLELPPERSTVDFAGLEEERQQVEEQLARLTKRGRPEPGASRRGP